MPGGVRLGGRGMEREIPMDREEGATGEVPMETGEGATRGGDPWEHMLAHLHTRLTAAETRVEDLEVEVAARDV